MLVGVLAVTQLFSPSANLSNQYTTFGRIRPLHTNAVIFAFVGNAIFMGVYYSLQRLCKARMFSNLLSKIHFWGWQLIILSAVATLPLGITTSKEYAELEWPIDIAITVVWVVFGINMFGTIIKRRERHLYVAIWLQHDGLNQFLTDARQAGNLQSLSADRKVHAVRKKQFIYTEGDEPTRLYFLKSGKVKTVRTNTDGKELITGFYNPGELFGYLLENTDYTDSAVTLEDSELVYIPNDDFRQLLLANPEVGQQFIKLLAGRVSEREQQLVGMAYNSLRRRVADALLRLHTQQPGEVIQLSHDDLASMVGTATESLIRTLSEFRQDAFIEQTTTGGIRVVQPDKLRRANW